MARRGDDCADHEQHCGGERDPADQPRAAGLRRARRVRNSRDPAPGAEEKQCVRDVGRYLAQKVGEVEDGLAKRVTPALVDNDIPQGDGSMLRRQPGVTGDEDEHGEGDAARRTDTHSAA